MYSQHLGYYCSGAYVYVLKTTGKISTSACLFCVSNCICLSTDRVIKDRKSYCSNNVKYILVNAWLLLRTVLNISLKEEFVIIKIQFHVIN